MMKIHYYILYSIHDAGTELGELDGLMKKPGQDSSFPAEIQTEDTYIRCKDNV